MFRKNQASNANPAELSMSPSEAAYAAAELGDMHAVEKIIITNPGAKIDFSYVLVSAARANHFNDDKSLMKFLSTIQSPRFQNSVVITLEKIGPILRMTDLGIKFEDFHVRMQNVFMRMNDKSVSFESAYDAMMQELGASGNRPSRP